MNGKSMQSISRHIPAILTGLSAVGVVATSVLAVKATPKAFGLIKADSRVAHDGDPYAYTKWEAVKSCWKCYIPAAAVGLSTIACVVGANILNKRKQASIASAYALLHRSYQQYRGAAKSVFSESADSQIVAQMAKDTYISADGVSLYSHEMDSESEKILCYDMYSQRYFTATMASVLNAQYHINRNLSLRGCVSVNEFYEFLGLDKLPGGCGTGWSYDGMEYMGFLWLDFENAYTEMDDGLQCCVISACCPPEIIE